MQTNLIPLKALVFFLAVLTLPTIAQARHFCVDSAGAGNHTGSSWGNACTLFEAVYNDGNNGTCFTCPTHLAKYGDTIWVKKGNYVQNYNITYGKGVLLDGIKMYGGFAGNETGFSQRVPGLYKTQLLNFNDPTGGNFNTTNSNGINAAVDGITFNNCQCDFQYDNAITNCTFINGSAAFDYFNHLPVTNCTFLGLGSMNFSDGIPTFTNCTFKNLTETRNNADAVLVCGHGANFYTCVFDNNYSHSPFGGAIWASGGFPLIVENCLFTNNTTAGAGGAIYSTCSGGKIINNTFANNRALGSNGNAVYDAGGNTIIANNIMWNANTSSASMFYFDSSSSHQIPSDIYSNNFTSDGSGRGIRTDPKLTGNYTLSACSPAINAGSNSYTTGLTTDLAGNTRIWDGTVDVGCYEFEGVYANNAHLIASATSACSGVPVQLNYTSSYYGTGTFYWIAGHDTFITYAAALTSYPTLSDTDFYVTQFVPGLGCSTTSDTIHITVYPAPVAAVLSLATPQSSDTVCVGTNISATAIPGSGGSPGCSDYFRYCTDGGNIWQPYVPGSIINTSNAYSSVLVQTRRGGCTNCPYTNWQTIASWPVKQTIAPSVNIIGSNVLQQGFPATFNAAITYGGTAPVYSWTLNGGAVGTNSATYIVNAPADGDVLICALTSNYVGCLVTTSASDTVTLSVSTDYITSPNLCVTQPMTVHFNITPSVVYWEHYNNYPDTAYASWAQSGTTVVNNTGGFAGICTDAQSNIYVADYQHNVVWKYAPGQSTGVVVAGNSVSGAGSAADQLNDPVSVFVDASNNLYVLDAANYRVQKWALGATSGTTVAGGNGKGTAANQFWANASSMTVSRYGSIYVSDPGNGRIQMWSPGATSGLTAASSLNAATAIAVDDRGTSDTLYLADATGEVLKWAYGASSGVVVAGGNGIGAAGNQLAGYIPSIYRNLLGDIYIADRNNGRVQLWHRGATTGVTVAGIGGYGYLPTQLGDAWGLALNNTGDIYVSQNPVPPGTATLVKFASQFTDTTYLPYEPGYFAAEVFTFNGVGTQTNTLIINDVVTPLVSITTGNNVICQGGFARFIPAAVNGGNSPLYRWYVNGILADSSSGDWVTGILQAGDKVNCELISSEVCVTTDTATSNSITMQPFIISVDIVAEPADAVCQGEPVTFISRTQNGGNYPSFTWLVNGIIYGSDSIFTYPNPAHNDIVRCVFTSSSGCSAQPTDTSNSIVIKVSSSNLTASGVCAGTVLTDSVPVVPSLLQWLRNDTVIRNVTPQWNSTGTQLLNHVYGIGIFRDGEGNIYLSDAALPGVRKYVPGDTAGIIVAGGNGLGFTGNQMYMPGGIYVDTMGNIYVADYYRVSKWSAQGVYLGTVAGSNNPGTGANQLDGAVNLYIDKDGNLYVCDENNERVQKFAPGSTNGVTVAGGNGYGNGANQISYIQGVDVDAAGNVYVADYSNDRVQKWAPGATFGVTVAGGNGRGTAPNQLWAPANVHVAGAGNIFVTQANGSIALWLPGATSGTTILSGTNVSASTMGSTGDIFVLDRNDGQVVQYSVLGIADTFTANTGGAYSARILSFSGCSITTDADTVYDNETPSLSILSDQGDTVCSGKLVTFSATALHAGSSPAYLWTKNGQPVGDSSDVYVANYILQNDTIRCVVQADNVCLTNSTANSNKIIMNVRQPVYGTGSAYINPGDTLYLGGQVIADSGTYVLTLASVYDCDSIVTTHFNLCSISRDTIPGIICSGDSILFGGLELAIAGTYSDTLQNINGCDSIVTLILTVMPGYNYTFNNTICSNESFAFGGQLLNTAGSYTDTLNSQYGCDSIVTINLTVRPTASSTLGKSICAGSTYNFNGQALSVAGAYHDTLTSINGCDSIITLNLAVLPVVSSTLNQSICAGSTYNFKGQVLSAAGAYYDTLTSVNGCDSIVTLNLTVLLNASSSFSRKICTGSSYNFNGQVLNAAGVYYDTLTSANGCDSIVTLNLAVNSILYDTLNQSICQGGVYLFHGTGHSVAGTYYDTLMASGGCDSIEVLNLSIIPTTASSFSQTICSGSNYSFGGQTLTTSGTYIDTLSSTHGCDSIVTLILSVNNINDTATVNGAVCSASAAGDGYQWINCTTGMAIANATSQTYTALQNADYACIVTQGNCTDTTNCVTVVGLDINEARMYRFDIFPNPTAGIFTVQHNYKGQLTLQIIDGLGRKVKEFRLSKQVEQFDITDLAGGLYEAFIFNGVEVAGIVKVIKQ